MIAAVCFGLLTLSLLLILRGGDDVAKWSGWMVEYKSAGKSRFRFAENEAEAKRIVVELSGINTAARCWQL
jgi:hypothetical protein